jgi:RNA polymerase sigma-70 factor (ECF subfamily)
MSPVETREKLEQHLGKELPARPGTLGEVLYPARGAPLEPEAAWVALVRAVAAGDQSALNALYDRAHRVVFTLAVRITFSRESAEEVTVDVFHDVWRRAAAYDPANGTVLGWVANMARSRAIDRLRFELRKKRVDPGTDETEPPEAPDPRDVIELRQQSERVRRAVSSLGRDERGAIELAFFSGLTYAEVAERLQQPLGTIKTRIRSALQKLRRAMESEQRST